MDDIIIVGLSTSSKAEKLRLPSVQHSKKKFLNLSQNYIPDPLEEAPEPRNESFNVELFEIPDSSRVLRKHISAKRSPPEVEEPIVSRDIAKPLSPVLGIKGIITPTHTRMLRPIIKKPSYPLAAAKKRKPLKLLSKISPKVSSKQEMFMHWGGIIRSSNALEVVPMLVGSYKYFIGKGNNGSLINHIVKSRFWWTRVDAPELANLVWTQLRHKQTLEKMPATENMETFLSKGLIPSTSLSETEKSLGFNLLTESPDFNQADSTALLQCENLILHNRLQNNSHICNKKSLFKNMRDYYTALGISVFSKIPLTFHIELGASDPALADFESQYTEGSVWIIKPGEGTNRGNGIKVSNELSEIKEMVLSAGSGRSYIVQKYIEKPLLINKRKFDIRCYALVTCYNGVLQAYFYREGYLRTTCKEFSLKSMKDKFVHLTNDAIQKNAEDYGKYESGNKLSYNDFQKYLTQNHPGVDFQTQIHSQIQDLVCDSIKAVSSLMMSTKKSLTFEVFGYDFMVDQDLGVWLIEVNTNPCLELGCSYLAKLIPEMLENAFKVALDPLFPPQTEHKKFKNWVEDLNFTNRFALIYRSMG
jgi:tubulin---tyrosine ligase